jgi:hypothetical protein
VSAVGLERREAPQLHLHLPPRVRVRERLQQCARSGLPWIGETRTEGLSKTILRAAAPHDACSIECARYAARKPARARVKQARTAQSRASGGRGRSAGAGGGWKWA